MSLDAPPLRLVSVTTAAATEDDTGSSPVAPPPAALTAVSMAVATAATAEAAEIGTEMRRPEM